jgi:hypothetical protein
MTLTWLLEDSLSSSRDLPADLYTQPALSAALFSRALIRARNLAIAIVGCAVLSALIYVVFIRAPVYRAQATIGPVANSVGPSGATQAFAAYAGVDIGAGDTGRFGKYLQVLHSYRLAERLENRHHVLRYLVPGWDEQNQCWKPPSGLFPTAVRFVKGILGYPAWQPPDAGILADVLSRNMRVERVAGATILDTKNQISTITLDLGDRELARTLLGEIIVEADGIVREDQLLNTTDRINYLSAMLRKAPEVFLIDSLQRIHLEQERTLMTLKADRRYSVDLIDPPNAERNPIGLSGIFLLIMSVVLGVIVYTVAVLFLLRRRIARYAGDARRAVDESFPDPFAWIRSQHSRSRSSAKAQREGII